MTLRGWLQGLLSLVGLVVFALTVGAHHGFDARIYAGAIRSWIHSGDLYDWGLGGHDLGFTYPPFAAVLLSPLALLHGTWPAVAMAVVSAAAAWWCFRALVPRNDVPVVTAVAAGVALLNTTPVRDTLGFGQVNILLGAMVLVDLAGVARGGRRGGLLVGLATAVKLTPGIFIVFLLLQKQTRTAALRATATFAGLTAVTAAVFPGTSWRFWHAALWDTKRVGSLDSATNQSITGVVARLSLPSPCTVTALVVVLVALLGAARGLWNRGAWLEATLLVGICGTMLSPISWMHHLVWQSVAALVVLVRTARTRRWASLICFAALMPAIPDIFRRQGGHHMDGGLVPVLGENAFFLLSLVLAGLLISLGRDVHLSGSEKPEMSHMAEA